MNDDQFEELLNQAGAGYNLPPEVPRAEMWEAIEAGMESSEPAVVAIASGRGVAGWRSRRRQWMGLATAAAALLVLGVGIGRLSVPVDPVATRGVALVRVASGEPLQRVTREHFSKTEALLSMVNSDAHSGRVEGDVGSWAAQLLFETRLLMNSGGGQDAAVTTLLQDLELILIQVARLNRERVDGGGEDLRLITEGMNDQNVMMRIRAMMPAAGI